MNEAINLLEELHLYAKSNTPLKKARSGRYIQALEDCISTLRKGDFKHIIERDKKYSAFWEKISKKNKEKVK